MWKMRRIYDINWTDRHKGLYEQAASHGNLWQLPAPGGRHHKGSLILRTNCFDLIKGRQTPSSFKFVFLLSPENMEHTLSSLHSAFTVSDISGFFINIRYQSQLLTLTTGISYNIFSADKTLDSEWDKLVMKFLANNDINFKELWLYCFTS